MNEAQKKVMIAVSIAIMIAFLFPPHAIFVGGEGIHMGYAFIANIPERNSVHIIMLLVEWLGIGVIGGIFYCIAKS